MTQVPSSKPERSRSLRDERESTPGTVLPWEQGRFFSQLFSGKGDGEGFSSFLGASMTQSDQALVEAFAEQLVPRLNAASQWPLQAAFSCRALAGLTSARGASKGPGTLSWMPKKNACVRGSAACANAARTA